MKTYQNASSTQHTLSRRTFLLGAAALLAPSPAFAAEAPAKTLFGNVPAGFVAKRIRVHVLRPIGCCAQDAIALEFVGASGEKVFALVDGGFGPEVGLPHEGYVNRYPANSSVTYEGITEMWHHTLSYLESLGVNSSNVAFYMGSHPHNDHMGCAAELIREFSIPVVYTPEYSDEYIKPSAECFTNTEGATVSGANLSDCQFLYDRTLDAAHDVGATVINSIDSARDATFSFGGVKFTITNYDCDYREREGDARYDNVNNFSWGLLVEGCDRRLYFGADMYYWSGAEQRIAQWIGEVDFYKMAHHGNSGSNGTDIVAALNPKVALYTNWRADFYNSFPCLLMMSRGTRLFSTFDLNAHGNMDAFVIDMDKDTLTTNLDGTVTGRQSRDGKYKLLFKDGKYLENTGFVEEGGKKYYCSDIVHVSYGGYSVAYSTFTPGWTQIEGRWHHFNTENGTGTNGWLKAYGVNYLSKDGEIQTGWVSYKSDYYFMTEDYRWLVDIMTNEIDGLMRGFDKSGKLIVGGRGVFDGKVYFFDGKGVLYAPIGGTGWSHRIGGVYYFFKNYAVQTGLVTVPEGYSCPGLYHMADESEWGNGKDPWARNTLKNVNGDLYYFGDDYRAVRNSRISVNSREFAADSKGRLTEVVPRSSEANAQIPN